MKEETESRELWWVALAAFAAVLVALGWSIRHGALLLYGDAEAHLHIARRVFDSQRPRFSQLGTVWLPLPHILLLPFVNIDSWWRSGLAGAFPSMAETILAAVGLFKLARRWMGVAAATFVLALFILNPNVLYVSTTALTEPLFLAELVWSVVLLLEWCDALAEDTKKTSRLLWLLIAVLVAAVYTRYDGWVLGFVIWLLLAVELWKRKKFFSLSFVGASVVLAAAPVLWLIYNAVLYKDPLDFLRGQYSAAAIEARTSHGVFPPHPGWHNPWESLLFYCKDVQMVAGEGRWGEWLFWLALAGALWFCVKRDEKPGARWALLLWLPLPFYCYSVAYGSVPIFLPVWWPHNWYNTRYGLELMPAIALGAGFCGEELLRWMHRKWPRYEFAIAVGLMAVAALSTWQLCAHEPIVLGEGRRNNEMRGTYEREIASRLKLLHELRPDAIVLMDSSSYPGVVTQAGMVYKQTINESDLDLYDAALKNPSAHTAVAISFTGDDVETAMKRDPAFKSVWKFDATWQPTATIYVTDTYLKSSVGDGNDR
jgi:hypothetical protein